jgi:hypothetical protein
MMEKACVCDIPKVTPEMVNNLYALGTDYLRTSKKG